ncbi:MAG: hypothetical protein UY75_C0038G0008 [Parcubacteria group bacterium GW2011_GWC2_52_8c]|nr:MAG: hypothetical protein UY75_C0038G0008 [Parcubacteria group bacterium GW2011_GWC2_52_8c]
MRSLHVGVIGVGMVGTPLARYFEERMGYRRGKELFLFDTNPDKNCSDDIGRADVIFVCLPTPPAKDGSCDLSRISGAVKRIRGSKIVVIKSTVPPGTTESLQKKYPRHKFLFNPENLTERNAWEDFVRPDVQSVGFTAKSKEAAAMVLSLLPKAPFMSPWGVGTYHRVEITATEAEIIKYARNVHFARKVNFANLLAALANKLGVDYEHIRLGMAADFRIGDSHLDVTHGGYRGFGGYCLPKDLDALIAHLERRGFSDGAELLKADRDFNKKLLKQQGLTLEEVSVHDAEWIRKRATKTGGAN